MSKLTAVIIAKNEEQMIKDCLKSLSFADVILVIDNNSTDNTAEIAKKYGAKVISSNQQNFADIRNEGKEKVKTTYILYIDADERVSPKLADEIKKVIIENNISVGCYKLQRKNYYLGNNPWPKVETLERLFRTKSLKKWSGALHESAEYEGEVVTLNSHLHHFTHRELESMVTKTNEWSEVEAKNRLLSKHPAITWWRFPRVMGGAFWDSYIRQQGYKAGTVGIIESIYQSFSIFITYAKLWELQQKK